MNHKMTNLPYKMSFTTGGLFRVESVMLGQLFSKIQHWETVRERALDENLFQIRTRSSAIRISKETIARLETLRASELDLLIHGSNRDQQQLLWLAICRRYQYITDFSMEVLRERYIAGHLELNFADYEYFFSKKSENHIELEMLKPSTQKKLRQVLFRMLREAEFLTKGYKIVPTIINPQLLKLLADNEPHEILIYPSNIAGSRV